MEVGEAESLVGEGGAAVSCSICLEAVVIGGDRSIAWLQCGHRFHLDCIGSTFNVAGEMECPNCRHVGSGTWLYANAPDSHAENYDDLHYIEMPVQHHWCPYCGFAGIPSSFQPGSSSFINSSIPPYYTVGGSIRPYGQYHYLQSGHRSLIISVPQIYGLMSFNRTPNSLQYQAGNFWFPPM